MGRRDEPERAKECVYPPGTKNAALNRLFRRWQRRYRGRAHEFHRDGIVEEARFRKSRPRVLFVLLEPNSKGGRFDKHRGSDLRAL